MQFINDLLSLLFRIGKFLCELIPILDERLFFISFDFAVFCLIDDDRLLVETVHILHRLVFDI